MNKITVKELLEQHGLTWYTGLYKRGAGSKSMCHDWVRGKHLPSTKSAAKIARALGLPLNYILDTLQTRDPWENSPRVTWGTHVRKALEASSRAEIKDRVESDGPCCITCHQKLDSSVNIDVSL